jgi:hypothetical protein
MNNASFGISNLTSSGSSEIFVAKLDANCVWLWAIRAAELCSDTGNGIALDLSDNCYITGSFSEHQTLVARTSLAVAGVDIIISKIDPNGNWLWAKRQEELVLIQAMALPPMLRGTAMGRVFFLRHRRVWQHKPYQRWL